MAFTYDSNQLSAPLNHLRYLIQDTSDAGHFFEDSEIEFSASEESNIYRAAAQLCRQIALKVLKRAELDDTDDGIKYDPEEKAKEYRELAKSFDAKAEKQESSIDTPSAGGIKLPKLRCSPISFRRRTHFSD